MTLGDGRVFTVSGGPGQAEIYSSVTGWAASPPQAGWPLFPHLFLLENGHLFFDGGNVFANPVGILPGVLNPTTSAFSNVGLPGGFEPNQRDHCASVLLPPAQDQKVMILGGGDPAISKVHIIDLKVSSSLVCRGSLASSRAISRQRRASAGSHRAGLRWQRSVGISPNRCVGGKIYHPTSNTWSLAAKAQVARMYHSIALLLPDGRVLAAGPIQTGATMNCA